MELDRLVSIDDGYGFRDDSRVLKWDERFLRLAREVAGWSKDPSTKVGAVCVHDRHIISTGYNGFPRGIDDDSGSLLARDRKYRIIIHAETNALLRTDKFAGSLYCWPLPPCSNCASLIIQRGVYEVISVAEWPERWNESIQLSLELFREAGIEVRLYKNFGDK